MSVEFAGFAGRNVVRFRAREDEGVSGKRDWRHRLGIPKKNVRERWEERVRGSRPEMPNYTIRIGDMVNDTPLPGLVFDGEKNEVRFEWRAMFCAFFREQDRFAVLKERWHTELTEKMQKIEQGDAIPAQDLHPSWPAAELQIRKQARRERLREWYEEQGNEEMVWAIESLRDYEKCRKDDGQVVRALAEIPGAGIGEKWFGSMFCLQALYMDETDCLHRINMKSESAKIASRSGGNANTGTNDGVRRVPPHRARSMSVASTITVS